MSFTLSLPPLLPASIPDLPPGFQAQSFGVVWGGCFHGLDLSDSRCPAAESLGFSLGDRKGLSFVLSRLLKSSSRRCFQHLGYEFDLGFPKGFVK